MKRVLVTGGAGYLGSILAETLLDEGFAVTVLDVLEHGRPSLLHLCAREGFEFVRGDARDERVLGECLRTADAIVPLAAVVGAPACDTDPERARSLNVGAIQTLLRLRSSDQRVVYPNTNSGYGTKSGAVHCTEETPLEPITLYGRTKVEAEAEVLSSPNSVTFRFATLFGASARMRLDLMVNHFTWAAVHDGYLVVFENGFRRNFLHVRDAARAFVHALGNSGSMIGQAYNAGLEDANLSKGELALRIREHVPGFFVHFAEIGSDPDKRDYVVSNARIAATGFVAKHSLDDGIAELLRAYAMMPVDPFGNA